MNDLLQLFHGGGGGYLVQKTLRGCATNMGSKIGLLVYEWPLIKCKIWYMNGLIFQNLAKFWAKIGSNLRKFWKKLAILFKIWPKIEPIGIWMGYSFLENWYLYGSSFKFCGGTSLPKPNLSTPPGFFTGECVFKWICPFSNFIW